MKIILAALFGLLSLQGSVLADCNIGCSTVNSESSCYVDFATAKACLDSISGGWKDQTLEVISQSLANFGFGMLYHNTGPPYNLQVPILESLDTMKSTTYETDFEFQEALQALLTSLLDAHTRYKKPVCYSAAFVLPVAFDISISEQATASGATEQEPIATFVKSTFHDSYVELFPDVDLAPLLSQPVSLVDGLEWTTAVHNWGSTHETRSNNPGARFNAAIRSFLYRSITDTVVTDVTDSLTFTMEDGTHVQVPWMTMVPDSTLFGNSTACLAEEDDSFEVKSSRHDFVRVEGEGVVTHASLHNTRASDRTVIISPDSDEAEYQISCFVQKVVGDKNSAKVGVNDVLVMKVASFSPQVDGTDYQANWKGFLGSAQTCLDTEYDMIVVDVMQNGGGYVCLGLRLLQLLIPKYWNDNTKVQMKYDLPHSDFMAEWIEKVDYPDPYTNPNDVEQILNPETQESFDSGKAYYYPGRTVTMGGKESNRTNWFCLDCREAEVMPEGFTPKRFVDPDKLLILTDGTCGSTCASFTRIAQEAGVATFVGTGGLWNQEMDVSSFAGGFVMNPTLLRNMTDRAGMTPFPQFETKQGWQFGWAAWYSQRLPTRPVQFTEQEPDHRIGFWSFPHVSVPADTTSDAVSSLYDSVISDQMVRLAEDGTCNNSDAIWIALVSTLGVIVLGLLVYLWFVRREEGQGGQSEGGVPYGDAQDVIERQEGMKQPLVES